MGALIKHLAINFNAPIEIFSSLSDKAYDRTNFVLDQSSSDKRSEQEKFDNFLKVIE